MIYARFGDPVTIVRRGTLADVKALDKRKPDAIDKQNVANGCYVVARYNDSGTLFLAALAFLRCDDAGEITKALEALEEEK